MKTELFVYWHVAPAASASAVVQAQAFQHALRVEHAGLGLETRLYRRDDPARQRVTVMETYAVRNGLPAALQAAVTAPAWCPGARHVERFEAIG